MGRHNLPQGKRPAFKAGYVKRNYVIEFFNHPASKGETVFCGTRAQCAVFLKHESNTLLTPTMQSRADEFLWYFRSLTAQDMASCDGFYWPLENLEERTDVAYYYLSMTHGRRAKRFADN